MNQCPLTKYSLAPDQRGIVEIIEGLGFGRIERLQVHCGELFCDSACRIVQEIKLGSVREHQSGPGKADLPLKKEFEDLFSELRRFRDGIVHIEVRHGLPFRLVLERRHTEFAVGGNQT